MVARSVSGRNILYSLESYSVDRQGHLVDGDSARGGDGDDIVLPGVESPRYL